MIHPTAIVDPGAELDPRVSVGPYAIIAGGVRIGSGTEIGSHVRIESGTELGKDNRIYAGAALGIVPQHQKYQGEETRLLIGNGNTIREFVTISRGTGLGGGITRVGDDNFLMNYCHLAHDCQVGSRIVMANGTQVSGHVTIEDDAVFSGLVGVHQFVRIGGLAMIGGGAMVVMDVPPFAVASGDRARLYGVNRIGLKRKGLSADAIRSLQKAYQLLFRSGGLREEALARVEKEIPPAAPGGPEVRHLLDFLRGSERGVTRFHAPAKSPESGPE